MQLQGGRLDRIIEIMKARSIANEYNEQVDVFESVGKISARKVDVSSGEATRNAEVSAQLNTRFTVRCSSMTAAITANDCIKYNNQYFNIVGKRELQDRRLSYVELDAVTRLDALNIENDGQVVLAWDNGRMIVAWDSDKLVVWE